MAYFSNSSEGGAFENACCGCPLYGTNCPIAAIQSGYNYEQMKKGNELAREIMDRLVNQAEGCRLLPLLENKNES